MAGWNLKLIFDPQEGFPALLLDGLLGLLERQGFWTWVAAEEAPPYAVGQPQSPQVLVLNTHINHHYTTLLASSLEVVESLLLEQGGSLELRPLSAEAATEVLELHLNPRKATVTLSFSWPLDGPTLSDWLRLFRQMCDRFNPLAGCVYRWEALVHSSQPTDDLTEAAHLRQPPPTLHALTYFRNDYLGHIGLERLSPVCCRQDYWRHGLCVWLEHGLEGLPMAVLQANGAYHKKYP